jgi:hypothetical protein
MLQDHDAVDERQQRLIEIPEQPPKPLRVIAPSNPVWTENKAQFIMRYLRYFVYITKHGTYIDGFAGPQVERETDCWAAKLVLESEPKRIRHFHLCDANPSQVARLEKLKTAQPTHDCSGKPVNRDIAVYPGDFNQQVDKILDAGTISEKEATFCVKGGRPVTQTRIRVVSVVTGEGIKTGCMSKDVAYVCQNVPDGSYYLKAEAPWYQPLISKTVTVKAGETTPLDLILQTKISKWLTSATTIWAGIVTLLLAIATPWILRRIFRPRLALRVRSRPPYCHWISPQFPEKTKLNPQQPGSEQPIEIYFVRVVIENKCGLEAEGVEVSIRQVYPEKNRWRRMPRFVPLNLRWSNTWDIVKAGEDAPGESRILTKNRISEGGERLCDLGFIVEPDTMATSASAPSHGIVRRIRCPIAIVSRGSISLSSSSAIRAGTVCPPADMFCMSSRMRYALARRAFG